MLTLFHHPMSAASRFIRLVLNEYERPYEFVEVQPLVPNARFLALNPGGHLPVLVLDARVALIGAGPIFEYLDETLGSRDLFGQHALLRAEIRRLIEWCMHKLESEVTTPIVRERVFKRALSSSTSPDSQILRQARQNLRPHLRYLNWLLSQRDRLAGANLSYADFAASASLSVLDFLGEVPWSEYPALSEWYSHNKSRPNFRPLLSDRIQGVPAASHYADLDF